MISHRHKVIFVHIPKTGGQSVEQMFLDDLGLGWDERAPLLLQSNDKPGLGPRRLAHLYAEEYVRNGHISQEKFDSYLKFTVVRNPYDRVISEYFYRLQNKGFWGRLSPEDFLNQAFADEFSDVARHLAPQTRYVMDGNGNCLVDKIIRFENISAEMNELSMGVFGDARTLPYRNRTKKTRAAKKAAVLEKIRGRIYEIFRGDFEAFGYDR